MKKLLWLLLLAGGVAHAGSATVTCDPPTQNTDNTPIPATGPEALASFSVLYGLCNNGALPAGFSTQTVPATACSAVVNNLSPGLWCFAVIATNNSSINSAQSNIATKQVMPAAPVPPSGVAVQPSDNSIYRIVQNLTPTGIGDLVMVAFGTVPNGTLCDGGELIVTKGTTYYRVDRTTKGITYFPSDNNRPGTLWAKCN